MRRRFRRSVALATLVALLGATATLATDRVILARWKEEVDDADATVGQLKMREQRLQKKLSQLRGDTTR